MSALRTAESAAARAHASSNSAVSAATSFLCFESSMRTFPIFSQVGGNGQASHLLAIACGVQPSPHQRQTLGGCLGS